MKRYLIDSNVIIHYIGYQFTSVQKRKLDEILDGFFHYSVISRIEVLNDQKADHSEYNKLVRFLNLGTQHDVDIIIGDKVIELRKVITKRKLFDMIIAATALVNNCTLLTQNIADFKNIPGLIVENPHDWI